MLQQRTLSLVKPALHQVKDMHYRGVDWHPLHALRAGMPVAVATGGNRKQVEASMRAAGLEGYFDAVVTCDVSN